MELTQADYEERINRRAAGQQTDEDLRLIKHYEANGFSTRDDSAGKAPNATLASPQDQASAGTENAQPVDDAQDQPDQPADKPKKATGRTSAR